jgi:hypothetical protein
MAGPGGLLSRGLLEEDATRYGALPRTKQERATLAGILDDYVSVHFPEYAKFHSGAGVVGVPGFWQELSEMVHIWKPRKYLLLPFPPSLLLCLLLLLLLLCFFVSTTCKLGGKHDLYWVLNFQMSFELALYKESTRKIFSAQFCKRIIFDTFGCMWHTRA